SRVLPVIRLNAPFGRVRRHHLLALFPNDLLYLKKRRKTDVGAIFAAEDATALRSIKRLRVRRRMDLASLTRVEVERTTIANRVMLHFFAGRKRLSFEI